MTLTDRDPDNLSPEWRPFGAGTGMGRGYRQDADALQEEWRQRSMERRQQGGE